MDECEQAAEAGAKAEPKCFVGERLGEISECTAGQLTPYSDLPLRQQGLFHFLKKEGETISPEAVICSFHINLPSLVSKRKTCSDPLNRHVGSKAKRETAMSEIQAKKRRLHSKKGYPGQPLCWKCNTDVNKLPDASDRRGQVMESESGNNIPTSGDTRAPAVSFKTPTGSATQVSPRTPEHQPGPSTSYRSPDLFADDPPEGPKCFLGYQLQQSCDDGRLEGATTEEFQALSLLFEDVVVPEGALICSRHRDWCLTKRHLHQRSCCNPFSKHGKRQIQTYVDYDQFRKCAANAVPVLLHDGLCKACSAEINRLPSHPPQTKSSSDSQQTGSSSQEITSQGLSDVGSGSPSSQLTVTEKAKVDLQNILRASRLQQLELSGYHDYEKLTAARDKYAEVKEKVKQTLSLSLGINEGDIEGEETAESKDLQCFVEKLKSRIQASNSYNEKLALLTLAPASWSYDKVSEVFQVTQFAARKAAVMREEKGILPSTEAKCGRPLSKDVEKLVFDFFHDPEFSRESPGSKQVSIGKGNYQPKRLLLGNLGELYKVFKTLHPDAKIGRSKFCEARPKWCVLPSASGTHNVYVCVYHENFKLLLDALGVSMKSYKDVIRLVVCSTEDRECMLRMCPRCPSQSQAAEIVRKYVEDKLFPEEGATSEPNKEGARGIAPQGERDDDVTIKYRQWLSTDRPNLETIESGLPEFIDLMTRHLKELIPHSFIATQQTVPLKRTKENLKEDEVVVLMDFAENWTYKVQDEIQSHHFQNGACALHPVVVYYREGTETKCKSLCFFSEDLRHDVAFVDSVVEQLMQWLKVTLPAVKKVEFFTDRCAGQYKCCSSFLNLCSFEKRLDVVAKWSFFATSHGKATTDGVGGTLKRALDSESLRRVKVEEKPLTNVNEVLTFCQKRHEEGSLIKPFLIGKEDLVASRQRLASAEAQTVQGTRSFHSIQPVASSKIRCKKLSSDTDEQGFVFDLLTKAKIPSCEEYTFVACCVQVNSWEIAFVEKVDYEMNEAQIKMFYLVQERSHLSTLMT